MQYRRHPSDYESITPTRHNCPQADEPEPLAPESSTRHSAGGNGASYLPSPAAKTALVISPTASELNHKPVLRRGHALSYAGLLLFTVVLYFRPYELFPALAGFNSMAFWLAVLTLTIFVPSQLVSAGTLTARPREVNLVLLLCGTALLSIPLALNPKESWDAFVDFLKVALMFIVMVNVVRTERRLKGLLWITLAVSCVLSVSALQDYRSGNLVMRGERVAGIIGGMFANPNDMALHLVTIIPLVIALFLTTRGLHKRMFYGACAILMTIGCVVTFSRGGLLGLLGAVTVLAWKVGRKHHVAVLLIVVVALVAFVALVPSESAGRLGSIADASATQRLEILIRSIIVALRHPLLGIGMGNFHIVSIHELVSHNAYTQVAAEMGFTAFVCYMMFMIVPYRQLRRIERESYASRQDARAHYLAIGLQASLIGYIISSFFASVAYLWYVYYLVGYAVSLRYIYESSSQPTDEASTKASARLASHEIQHTDVLASSH